ncbi:MAG: hypothetical protein WCW54_01575 [Candidatus Paceibacterota bacterium]
MSYKDDEELSGIEIKDDEEDVLISPDDLDDPLDDDLIVDDDLIAIEEEDDELEDFVGLDGSPDY